MTFLSVLYALHIMLKITSTIETTIAVVHDHLMEYLKDTLGERVIFKGRPVVEEVSYTLFNKVITGFLEPARLNFSF